MGQDAIGRDLIGPLFALFATRYTARVTNLIAEGDQVVAEIRGDVTTKQARVTTTNIATFIDFVTG